MVDFKGKPVVSYLFELLAGAALIIGVLMLVGGVIRADVIGIVLGVVLVAAGVYVFKRPGRARRAG